MENYKFRTQKEAAKYAGVTDRTIRRWIEEGMLNKGEYTRERLNYCKQEKHRERFAKAHLEEVKQLCQDVEGAIEILSNIGTKLNQLLTSPDRKSKGSGNDGKGAIVTTRWGRR